jgi:6-phosphogluconolactonase
MSSPHVLVLENPDAVAHAAQRLLIDAATKAIDAKGAFTVALSGGSTPRLLFRLLAKGAGTVPPEWPFDWSKVHVFFVDERCVPPTHEESNYGMARDELLSRVPIPPSNVHRMRGEIDPNEAAKEYGELLKDRFGDGGPDVILLGMGEDGHTASLFPHTPALNETNHRCVAQFVEKSTTGQSWRITLTAPFINRATEVLVTVTGANKAERLKEVLRGPCDPQRLPIQLIQPPGKLVWLVDEPAYRCGDERG